jgi:hypothetical protein
MKIAHDSECTKEYGLGLAKGRQGEGKIQLIAHDTIGVIVPSTKRHESYLAGIRQGLEDKEKGFTVNGEPSEASGGGGGGGGGDSPLLLFLLGIYWPLIAFGLGIILPIAFLKWMFMGGKHPVEPEPNKVVKPFLARIGIRIGLAFLGFILLGIGDSTADVVKTVQPYFKDLALHNYQFPNIWEWLQWYALDPLLFLAQILWAITLAVAGIKLMIFGRVLPKRYHQ